MVDVGPSSGAEALFNLSGLPIQRTNREQNEDTDKMSFQTRGKNYSGGTAIEVVRAMERDDKEYRHCGGPIRQYLIWSLGQLGSSVPPRDLDLSNRLEDETLALGYLLLLDEYGVGEIVGQLIDQTSDS